MNEKVTSYEISQRLSELGFDCESHCGWWGIYEWDCDYRWDFELPGAVIADPYKAYDCWDLLMWLRTYSSKLETDFSILFGDDFEWRVIQDRFITLVCGEYEQPQNALGLAVIKILEEKE